MISNEILTAIDAVNTEVENSSFCVLESMVSLYSKQIDFMDFCSNELKDEYIMEGTVLDNVKKAGKKDSNKLVTFLMFIPRLIKEMCKAISKAFSDSSLGKKLKEASNKFEKYANAEEKKAKVNEINEKEGKDVVYFDEKSGKIKFKKTWKDAFGAIAWLAGTGDLIFNLFTKIKAEFDVTNPSKIRTFVDECDKIIHKKKEHSLSEVIDMGLGALGDFIGHISGIAGGLTSAGVAASTLVDKKLKEIKINGGNEEDHDVLVSIKELSNKLTIINAAVFAGTKILSVAKKVVGYINIPIKLNEEDDKFKGRVVDKIYSKVTKTNPKILDKYPQNDDESDDKYKIRIVQTYYEAITKKKLPADATADEITEATDKALDDIYKNAEDSVKGADMKAYEAAVQKYYDEKKKLHEENPTKLDKAIKKIKGKKTPKASSDDSSEDV